MHAAAPRAYRSGLLLLQALLRLDCYLHGIATATDPACHWTNSGSRLPDAGRGKPRGGLRCMRQQLGGPEANAVPSSRRGKLPPCGTQDLLSHAIFDLLQLAFYEMLPAGVEVVRIEI